IKQSNSKNDWFLSEEEFKLWNRRYRLRDTDEIQEIRLPQVQFLSLHNEENRLGECSYELEIKSYLQMEDISSASGTPRNEYNPLASGTFTSNKKSSFAKNINQGTSVSMTESDEECAEIFKQIPIKSTEIPSFKKKSSEILKKDQPKKENKDVVVEPLDTDGSSTAEHILQVDLQNGKRASDTGEVTATCAVNENGGNPSCGLLTDCQFTNKSTSSFTGNFFDSGYNSFSDEKSLSSSLFLSFEDELDIAKTGDQFFNCHSLTKEVLANVERFLSHSPPPLSGLSDLEYEISKGSALENSVFLPYSECLQNDKSTNLMSHSAVNSQQNLELNSLKFITHPSETTCLHGTTNDNISDEPNFCDSDKVHKNSKNEHLVSSNQIQINIGPSKDFAEEKNHDVDNSDFPILHTAQDESLLLFEDVNMEFNDVSPPPLNSKCESLCTSDRTAVSEMAPVSQFFISDELLLENDSEPQDQIVCDTNMSWKSHEGLRGIHEEKLNNDENNFDCSKDLFSVTFDLGFCSTGSEDEVVDHASVTNNKILDDLPGRHLDIKQINGTNCVSHQAVMSRANVDNSTSVTTTHPSSEDKPSPAFSCFSKNATKSKEFMSPSYSQFSLPVGEKVMSTPLSESSILNSFSKTRIEMAKKSGSNIGKVDLHSFKETLNSTFGDSGLSIEKCKSKKQINLHQSCHSTEDLSSSDESDNFHKRDPLSEDFKDHKRNAKRSIKVRKKQNHLKLVARKFLDEEAELSQEDAECVSSDENDESENEQDSSLLDFLNDETQLSQAINDSEMRAVYMKSVRSPLMSNRYKMVHKKHNNINIFSQIPEQDETYLEDSFCVDEEESCKSQSSDEVCVDFNLITEDCYTNESKKYKTRRAVKLKQMKMRQNCARSKNKLSRIILLDDSSEEEHDVKDKREFRPVVNPSTVPSGSSLQSRDHSNPVGNQLLNQRQQTPPNLKVPVSDVSNFKPQNHTDMESASSLFTTVSAQKDCGKFPVQLKGATALEDSGTSAPCCSNSRPHLADTHACLRLPQEGHRTCILVDSREIVSGSEVVSSLRAIHGLQVEVCPLNGCDYIVSNRMVVERRSQSEMLNSINKNKLIDQIQYLQSMFERICVIVEKDREKTGDTSRMFRRTKSYDSLLTTLIGAGIRILFSSCQEETADLLKELSLVEQRKNAGIHVPTVANSNKCETLQFYLSIPNISYITALNMCHQFSSVKKMTNSTPQEISMYAKVTHQKAEEIYRYIHYIFDMQMLPPDPNRGSIKSDT
ncbi:FANCM, partial [Cervus elaphus hippelaphus]